jgi:hypothetical protein
MTDPATREWVRRLLGRPDPADPPEPEKKPSPTDDDAQARTFVGRMFDRANQDD